METADESGATRGRQRRTVRLDSRRIRALAHPLRARLLGALRVDGPATATTLAKALGTNTGATSYHLRQLAEVGLVVEEAERGTGRQRWWRAAHDISSWQSTDFDDDPDARAASDWYQHYQVSQMAEQSQRWVTAQHEWPRPWRKEAGFNDYLLTLSPRQVRSLHQEIWQLIQRYDREPPTEVGDADEGRQVQVFYSAFPRLPERAAGPWAADETADEAAETADTDGAGEGR